MRNFLLSAVSVLALAISGAAFAGQTSVDSSQDQATQTTTEQSSAESGAAQDSAAQSSEAQDSAAGSSEAAGTDGGATVPTAPMEGQRYGSYQAAPDGFSGDIAGGYMADDLIGKSLVDASGDSVGEVNDLLIGANNRIEKVLVDVGGFLGLGERRVALDIEELQLSEDGNFVTAKTEEELENMPEFNQFDAEWTEVPTAQ